MTKLSDAIKARAAARPTTRVEASQFLLDAPEGCAVHVRPLVVGERDEALAAALKYRKTLLADLGDKAAHVLDDTGLIEDPNIVERVWRATLDETGQPAFPSAAWMREHMTADEVTHLYGVLDTVQRKASPTPPMDLDDRESLAQYLASVYDNPHADAAVLRFPREFLADMLLWACKSLVMARENVRIPDTLPPSGDAAFIPEP
jgi:hypothetical protein